METFKETNKQLVLTDPTPVVHLDSHFIQLNIKSISYIPIDIFLDYYLEIIMKFITGDETGILKEFIPPKTTTNKEDKDHESSSSLVPNNKFNSSSVQVIVDNTYRQYGNQQQPIPTINNGSTSSSQQPNNNIQRLNPNVPLDRRYGIVDMTWIQQQQQDDDSTTLEDDDDDVNKDNDSLNTQKFATLSYNGTVQVWEKKKQMNNMEDDNNDDDESMYQKIYQIDNIFTTSSSDDSNHKDNNKNQKVGTSSNDNTTVSDDDEEEEKEDDESNSTSSSGSSNNNTKSTITTTTTTTAIIPAVLNPFECGLGIKSYCIHPTTNNDNDSSYYLIVVNVQGQVVVVDLQQRTYRTILYGYGKKAIIAQQEQIQGKGSNAKKPIYPLVSTFAMTQYQHESKQSENQKSTTTKNQNIYIAFGGRDRETVLYDLLTAIKTTTTTPSTTTKTNTNKSKQQKEKQLDELILKIEPIWKAKNLPPNPQTLLQPLIWPTAMTFLKQEQQNEQQQSSLLLAVGTGYKQLRIYDIPIHDIIITTTNKNKNKKQSVQTPPPPQLNQRRRPILFTPEGIPFEYRITTICQNPIQLREVIIGDAGGNVYQFNIDTLLSGYKHSQQMQTSHTTLSSFSKVSRYYGIAGSVRNIYCHPTLPRCAVVGLDRMLHIYDTKNKKQLYCVYLKQRLNTVLIETEIFDMKQYQLHIQAEKKKRRHDHDDDTDDDGSSDGDDNDSYNSADDDDVVQDYVDSSDEEEDKNPSKKNSKSNTKQNNKNHEKKRNSHHDDDDEMDDDDDDNDNSSDDDEDDDIDEPPSASDDDDDNDESTGGHERKRIRR